MASCPPCVSNVDTSDTYTVDHGITTGAAAAIAAAKVSVTAEQAIAAGIQATAQTAAALFARNKQKDLYAKTREWICVQQMRFRNEQMGGQEPTASGVGCADFPPAGSGNEARAAYARYITTLTRNFSAYMSDMDAILSALNVAFTESDSLINELYDGSLLAERLSNRAIIKTEQDADALIDDTSKRGAIVLVNDGNTAMAEAKVDSITLVAKEENQKIKADEARRGYFGGSGYQDILLLASTRKKEDSLAVNRDGTNLENVNRTEELEQVITKKNFELNQSDRTDRFKIYEDDADKRVNAVLVPSKKILQNDAIKIDGREVNANKALNRRYDNAIFKLQHSPPSAPLVPTDVQSPFAVGLLTAGNMVGGAISGAGSIL
jgi:hypothetical protein